MERVSIIPGKLPIIIVAPHGFNDDDQHTALLAGAIANEIDAYAVINNGWQRSDTVNFMLDMADCNNIDQCHEDVVREEFLDPIIRYKNRILQKHEEAFIYYIHGMSNKHRQIAGDDLDIVIGYGAGKPDSHSCEIWQKDLLCDLLNKKGYNAFQGSRGGPMSGWARSNMNQLFRKKYPEPQVKSMQIEIIHDLRRNYVIAVQTGMQIAKDIACVSSVKGFHTGKTFKSY